MNEAEIKSTFISRENVIDALAKLKSQIELEVETSARQDKALYRQQVFIKLNVIFRRQIVMLEEEATNFYNNNEYFLNDRINLLYEIIDYVNNEIKIAYIPDKLTLCSYFRVTAETWESLVNNYSLLKDNIRTKFSSLEEFVISLTTTGVEIGQLKQSAFDKLKLKGKFGGSNIEYFSSQKFSPENVITISENQTPDYLVNKYKKFQELENKK